MNHHLLTEQLTKKDKGRVFQKTDTLTSNCQVTQIEPMHEQLPQDFAICSGKANHFPDTPFPYFIHLPGSGQINESSLILFLELDTFLQITAYHSRSMYRRRQWSDEKNTWLIHETIALNV
jgi:hypothetical protein